MQVYTFSTGGCRDGFYLDNLSSTKDGIKELIVNSDMLCLDRSQRVMDFDFRDDDIFITIWDEDLKEPLYKKFELVTFNII